MKVSGKAARLAVPAVVIATMATASQPAWAATTSATQSAHFHLIAKTGNVRFLGERMLPGGDWTAAWHLFGETVRVAGPSGSSVIVPRPHRLHAMATIRPPAAFHKGSLRALAAAYSRAGKSVIQDAMAVGYTLTQARRIAGRAGLRSPSYSPGQIIQTPCASVSGDSGQAYGRTCDVQKMVQDNGGGNWIIGDEVTGSGNDTGPYRWNTLTNLTAYVNYGANNTIVQWTPNSSIYEGSCSTVSLGLTYDGVSLSDTQTICPDREDPYGTNTGNKFGSSWSGCDSNNFVEGVNAVDVDNNPSNASDWPGLTVSISWGYCL